MTKLTLELDLDKEDDRKIIELITKFKADHQDAKQRPYAAQMLEAMQATQAQENEFPSPKPKAEVTKEMNRVADVLTKQIGATKGKMSNKERASVAAKARWENVRAIKEGREPIKKALKKKPRHTDADYHHAEEHDLNQFPSQSAQDFVFNSLEEQPSYPDGREIIDGNFGWRMRKEGNPVRGPDENEVPLDNEYVEEIHKQAIQFERDKRR